jgi:hypothetical protein
LSYTGKSSGLVFQHNHSGPRQSNPGVAEFGNIFCRSRQ